MGFIESATSLVCRSLDPATREKASRLAARQLDHLRSPPSGDGTSDLRLHGDAYRIRRQAILDDYTGNPSAARLELLLCLGSGIIPLSALAAGLFFHSGQAVFFGVALLAPWVYYSSLLARRYHLKRSLTAEQQCGVVDDLVVAGLVEAEEAKRLHKRIRRAAEPPATIARP